MQKIKCAGIAVGILLLISPLHVSGTEVFQGQQTSENFWSYAVPVEEFHKKSTEHRAESVKTTDVSQIRFLWLTMITSGSLVIGLSTLFKREGGEET